MRLNYSGPQETKFILIGDSKYYIKSSQTYIGVDKRPNRFRRALSKWFFGIEYLTKKECEVERAGEKPSEDCPESVFKTDRWQVVRVRGEFYWEHNGAIICRATIKDYDNKK